MTPEGVERARKRMEKIDALPPEIRAVVHEHGWTIVEAMLLCGVKKGRQIAHLIRTVREGSVEIGHRERSLSADQDYEERTIRNLQKRGFTVIKLAEAPSDA